MSQELDLITLPLEDIHPYINNPRKNDNAVKDVEECIRQCGYNSPIVVDENHVILAGHTRLKALQKLGRTEAQVVVREGLTDEQKRLYRIADNKTGEEAEWDFGKLELEIDGLDLSGFEFNFDFAMDDPDDIARQNNGNNSGGYYEGIPEWDDEREQDEEYQSFVDKFVPKKTSDDCYTPDLVYQAVKGWACEKYGVNPDNVVRPFWPGKDYRQYDYAPESVVIDNPPFSILSEICGWYQERGIRFFLFAQQLTLFSTAAGTMNYVVVDSTIVYENGASINTGFITNMGGDKILYAKSLYEAIDRAQEEIKAMNPVKELPKYSYPDCLAVASIAAKYIKHLDHDYGVKPESCVFVRRLDAQKEQDKAIYGGGFLLSEKAAAEKAAAEKAAAEKAAAEKAAAEKAAAEKAAATRWPLSDREKVIVKGLK